MDIASRRQESGHPMSRYIATTILAVLAAVITANLVVSVEHPEHAPALFMVRP